MEHQKASLLKINSGPSTISSNPQAVESYSLFGDGYGEPLMTQHLVVDFTPQVEDTDFVQRKCCAFWEFIKSQKELQGLMMLSEPNVYMQATGSVSLTDTVVTKNISDISQPLKTERTAVSMLEFVEGKGLIDRTFEAKMHQSNCTLGSREYHENEKQLIPLTKASPLKKPVCTSIEMCSRSDGEQSATLVTESKLELQNLCKKMHEWNSEHPKSMEAPGHPPALSHCVMQRNVTH